MWENITRDITYLVYIAHFDYNGVLRMTPHERKYHLNYIRDARKQEQEAIKKRG